MQMDLSRLPQLPPVGAKGSSRVPMFWVRIGVYFVAAVILLWLLLWSRAQSKKINREALSEARARATTTREDFAAYLRSSSETATTLTNKGLALVDKNPGLASVILESASNKDPKFRDAALGAGLAELAVAESFWSSDTQAAHDYTAMAEQYLETAAKLDPIHAKTFELLAIVYTNLGKTDQAAQASEKAKTFAIKS